MQQEIWNWKRSEQQLRARLPGFSPKKQYIFNIAINNLSRNDVADMIVFRLGNTKEYEPQSTFPYFKQDYRDYSKVLVYTTPQFYLYENNHYFVDFANQRLGGGFRQNGAVQEELMFIALPQLAGYAVSRNALTRMGESGPGKGYPVPIIFEQVTLANDLNTKAIYGKEAFNNASESQLSNSIKAIQQPRTVNIIAMAAPQISNHQTDSRDPSSVSRTDNQINPLSEETIFDLYMTVYAGFQMAYNVSQGKCSIHSGKIGAGVFGNDPFAVFLIQVIAAKQVGLRCLYLHGYSDQDSTKLQQLYRMIFTEADLGDTIGKILIQLISTLQRFKETDSYTMFQRN